MDKKLVNWLKAAGVRAVKTVAQTAVATIGTAAVMDEVNWMMVGSAALLAGVLSLLTSVAGLPELSEQLLSDRYLCDKIETELSFGGQLLSEKGGDALW